ncbi:uncharacterized protein At1g15400-like [Nymphaea colorata]|uniref:MAPK kinase substrate protein n=1 Tax=Nymphaea colorata TaxID=210225 RepID=A0A5K1DZ36_9MAGN|nr:uncharacterized protein At1g15400-like [Nymphaea colorata]
MANAAALQRSAVSFRRQGSSGLVWDDRFLSGELAQPRKSDAVGLDGIEIKEPRSRAQQPQPEEEGASAAKKERRNKCTDNLCPATKPFPVTKRRTSRPPRPSATTCGLCGILCGHPPPSSSTKVRKR